MSNDLYPTGEGKHHMVDGKLEQERPVGEQHGRDFFCCRSHSYKTDFIFRSCIFFSVVFLRPFLKWKISTPADYFQAKLRNYSVKLFSGNVPPVWQDAEYDFDDENN